MRVGPSQLAGRVDADRESRGWVDGRGEEDKAGDGASARGEGRGARREDVGRERIGENRARLGFAMTNGRRGHSARRSYRSKRDYHVGLSVECLSRPGHLIRPRRGSFVFLVFQTRAAPHRAASGHAVFSFCSCDLSPALSSGRSAFPLSSFCLLNAILIGLRVRLI